jgi:predicted RNA-binding Zn ribbon-like protein
MAEPAPGELELVRAFVNTREIEEGTDELDSPRSLRAWLAERELLDAGPAGGETDVSDADLRHAIALREALRSLLRANNGAAADERASAELEAAARRAQLAVRFAPEARVTPLTGGVDGALGGLLARVAAAMGDGTWRRLKACSAEDCQWAFYDASRNRSGVWCTMQTCGNRAKARSFRERRG